jgi:hypothetical protein
LNNARSAASVFRVIQSSEGFFSLEPHLRLLKAQVRLQRKGPVCD